MEPIDYHYLQQKKRLQATPLEIFSMLTVSGTKADTLLLESGEPGSLKSEKSLLITDAAIRIELINLQLCITALSSNGEAFLSQFQSDSCELLESSTRHHLYRCPSNSNAFDIEQRLNESNVFSPLREMMAQLNALDQSSARAMMFSGLFGYDLIDCFEQLPDYCCEQKSKARPKQLQEIDSQDIQSYPDIYLIIPETLIVIDHIHQNIRIEQLIISGLDPEQQQKRHNHAAQQIAIIENKIANIKANDLSLSAVEKSSVNVDCSDQEYADKVTSCKQSIRQGEVFQIVPSRKFSLSCSDSLAAYHRLSQQNPSPYQFYISAKDFCLFGASPESAVKYNAKTRTIELYPIAGTMPRGKNQDGSINLDLDNRLECQLRLDSKELAEHMMLVDLARNDVARIAETGSRKVAELLKVDRYSQVMHLVSRVEGQLRQPLDCLHAYQACANMGTLTGAPKIRAMEILRRIELSKRDYYGGSVGYFDVMGNLDTAIIIRSAIVRNQIASVRAGAGVVFDSNPETEATETRLKASAVIRAISGETL